MQCAGGQHVFENIETLPWDGAGLAETLKGQCPFL